jgi:hypothetical protein
MDKLAFEKAVALADELVENNEVRLQIELRGATPPAADGNLNRTSTRDP